MTTGTILISLGIGLGVVLLFLIGFVFLKTALFTVPQKDVPPRALAEVDGKSVAERLGLAIQYKTIANQDHEKMDSTAFWGLHRLLKTLYPQVHGQLNVEEVNDYSLLYTWLGTNPELEPIMLTAHLDVVPAVESDESAWTHPPFSGEVADGYVWGRGAIDNKNAVISILEAVETLIKQNYKPERTIYLGFGHDEEISGWRGAKAIAELLESRGEALGALLDEGGAVFEGLFPDIDVPLAFIGISEKGYLSLRLRVDLEGGHSAMPENETAIGVLSKAIAKLEANPMPAHLEIVEFVMSHLGGALPFFQRLLVANTWLFGGILKKRLAKSKMMNAMMRTTTAPTIIKAGVKDNVLPNNAEAVVNFRLLPGDDLKSVYEMVQKTIGDDRVKISPLIGDTLEGKSGFNPSAVADTGSSYYQELARLIQEVFPEGVVSPYLILGATDARHYTTLTENCFRFSPMQIDDNELSRMHAADERLSFENCARMVTFYIAFLQAFGNLVKEQQVVPEAFASDEDNLPLPTDFEDEF